GVEIAARLAPNAGLSYAIALPSRGGWIRERFNVKWIGPALKGGGGREPSNAGSRRPARRPIGALDPTEFRAIVPVRRWSAAPQEPAMPIREIANRLWALAWSGPVSPNRTVRVERDLRLDFFRGLSLFFIFIDHIPGNVLAYATVRVIA